MFGETWFAVVPDGDVGTAAAKMLRARADKVIAHGSGRPWLLGNWPSEQMTVAEAGSARVAVLGRFLLDPDVLTTRLGRVRDVGAVDRVTAGLAGSFHLIASVGGRVRVRGSASAVRRVFHARVAGTTVAANRADVLASMLGAGVDEQVLALRLLAPPLTYPLEERCVWRGVVGLRPDDCLIMEPDGSARAVRWWNPPAAVLSLEEGAVAVREALIDAVATCTVGGGTVSADLSGGLDCTAMCFLAGHGPARLITACWQGLDPGNDDGEWAAGIAAELPGAERHTHITVERERTPLWFSGLGKPSRPTEEPCSWIRDRGKLVDIARRVAAAGSRLHMCGDGGEHLFTPAPSHLHDLMRDHPWTALARLPAFRAEQRVSWWSLLRALGDRGSFGQWLAASANRLTQSPPRSGGSLMAWQPIPLMPFWATPAAVRAAADQLRAAAAEGPEPLSPERSVHAALQSVRAGGAAVNQIDQYLADLGLGLEYAAPYTDDGVVEAALSVRLRERSAPSRHKPLLVAAMRGIVPAPILRREAQGGHAADYTADFYAGLRRHERDLLDLLDDPVLSQLGLIDAARARSVLRASDRLTELDPLLPTLACEVWLRSLPDGCRAPAMAVPRPSPPSDPPLLS